MKRRLMSFFLAVALVCSMLPAVTQPTQAAEAYNVVCQGSSIYAHGAPILITEGTLEGRTSIYLDTNKNGIVDAGEQTLAGAGVSGAPQDNLTSTKANLLKVFGGSVRADFSGDTFITMSGGRIGSIIGGNAADYDKGYFSGTSYIKVTGGMVNEDVYIGNVHERKVTATNSTKGTLIVSGNAVIRAITGGGNRGNEQFIGTTTGFVLADTTEKPDSFQNGILKIDAINYITKGTATAPADLPITIAAGETMTVKSGTNITINGKFVNNGTLIIEAGATLTLAGSGNANTGTVTNNGTFRCNSHAYDSTCDTTCGFCGATRSPQHNWNAATCDVPKTCSACGSTEGTALGHSYRYQATDVLVETCANNCGHRATATLSVEPTYAYTGSAITPAQVTYTDNWKGPKPAVSYENNVNAGTASASLVVNGTRLTVNFTIQTMSIADATIRFNPEVGTYNGKIQPPTVIVTLDGKTLVEGTDYTYSWNTDRILYPGEYIVTVRGKGAYTGQKKEIFQVVKGDFTQVKVEQAGTLVYNGRRQVPTVTTNVVTADGYPVEFLYSMSQYSSYGKMPSVGNAGTYTIYYWLKADDHNDYFGSFTVTVEKATVEVPILESKVYNGQKQESDIPQSDLYDVFHYSGTEVGEYKVELRLTDDVNYRWSTTDDPWLTLKFTITPAENSWKTEPSIAGWTYGQTPNAPIAQAQFGTVEVTYTGTANDGTTYSGTEAPTKAGSYTASFHVAATDSYNALEKSVDFTIARANYDLSGTHWAYSQPFSYDGLNKTVTLAGLPQGVTAQYAGNTAKAVGEYTATVTLSYDSHNYNQPAVDSLIWHIQNNWTPTEYRVSTPNENGWLKDDLVITAQEGYRIATHNTAEGAWETELTHKAETASGTVTIYLKNLENGTISPGKTISYQLDRTAPTGKIQFSDRTGWEEFLHSISFGLLYKEEVTVTVEAADTLSGIATVEYAWADKALTLEDVKALTQWNPYTEPFGVTLEDAKRFVYFARITDKAGNVFYLSSDGAEYDITAPTIDGITSGKTYYTTQTVTITDRNLDSVTLNGATAAATITLEGNREATYVIVATDKAGNATTVTVIMRPIGELAASLDNVTPENVNSSHSPTLESVKATVSAVDTAAATDAEKQALQDILNRIDQLDQVLADIQTEISRITNALNTYDPAAVNSGDTTGLQQLKKDIQALTDGNNLTDAEKAALNKQIEEINGLLKTVADTLAENARLQAAVEGYDLATVTSAQEEKLAELLEEIRTHLESTNLTQEEKNQLQQNQKAVEELLERIEATAQQLQQLTEDVTDYRKEAVKSSDRTAIGQTVQKIEDLLNTQNLTEEEAKSLENTKEKAENLLDIIADTLAENKRLRDEVHTFDPATVTSGDTEELKELLGEIREQLQSTHLTKEESAQLQLDEKAAEALLEKIEATAQQLQQLKSDVADYNEESVKSTDEADIRQTIQEIEELLKTENLTEEEAKTLEDTKTQAEDLLKTIGEASHAANTESVEKTQNITSQNVAVEDQTALEQAKADLEQTLSENAGNYTEQETQAIRDAIDRIQEALWAIENAKAVEEQIRALPQEITRKDLDQVREVEKSLDALTAHEKTLVSAELQQQLEAAAQEALRSQRNFRWTLTGIVAAVLALVLIAIPIFLKRKRS